MYPTGPIAASWDPNWITDRVRIDCHGLTKGPDMRHKFRAPIKCDGNPNAVFRVISKKVIRRYPNRAIAASWDPNYLTDFVRINCDGLTKGPDLAQRPTHTFRPEETDAYPTESE